MYRLVSSDINTALLAVVMAICSPSAGCSKNTNTSKTTERSPVAPEGAQSCQRDDDCRNSGDNLRCLPMDSDKKTCTQVSHCCLLAAMTCAKAGSESAECKGAHERAVKASPSELDACRTAVGLIRRGYAKDSDAQKSQHTLSASEIKACMTAFERGKELRGKNAVSLSMRGHKSSPEPVLERYPLTGLESLGQNEGPKGYGPPVVAGEIQWRDFQSVNVKHLSRQGYTVFIHFTADWCIDSKILEHKFIDSEGVRQMLIEGNIIPVQADYTQEEPRIKMWIAATKRPGVPVTMVLAAHAPESAIVLPKTYTSKTLLRALKEAGPSKARLLRKAP